MIKMEEWTWAKEVCQWLEIFLVFCGCADLFVEVAFCWFPLQKSDNIDMIVIAEQSDIPI